MDLECIFAEAILERSGFSIFFFSTVPITGGVAFLTVRCVEIGSFAKFPDLV